MFVVWHGFLHLILNIYFSTLNEFFMCGESVWALLGLCYWSIIAGAMSVILCMFVVIQFAFDLV
jgi:hypothetical protein